VGTKRTVFLTAKSMVVKNALLPTLVRNVLNPSVSPLIRRPARNVQTHTVRSALKTLPNVKPARPTSKLTSLVSAKPRK
jgi:hypothetical protein